MGVVRRRVSAAFLGISGWSYREWVGGLYPRGTKPADYLRHYARHFNAVEINATFYRTPTQATVARWHSVVPDAFRFAVKAPRALTHHRRLKDGDEELALFAAAMAELGDKRVPLLIQLPPSLKVDPPLLADFVDRVAAAMPDWALAVEFRHPSWLDPAVFNLLAGRGVSVAVGDMPACPIEEPPTPGLVFMRRHGPTGDYKGRYTDAAIARDADRIRRWIAEGREVWCFFNHGLGGHAITDAERLRAMLTPPPAEPPSPPPPPPAAGSTGR